MTHFNNNDSTTNIDGIPLEDAVEQYLSYREHELSQATLQGHNYRLSHLPRWAADRDDIADTADLTPRSLFEYRQWRQQDGDLNIVSVHTQMSTVRTFIKTCEQMGIVAPDLHSSVPVPSPDGADERESLLDAERAGTIREYLSRYQYASFDHVLFELLWSTGMRVGSARSIDVSDVDCTAAQLRLRHRPDSDTPLKNGQRGERSIALPSDVVSACRDYLDARRPDAVETTADGRREPFFVREEGRGRPSKTTLRRAVYRLTQPCLHSECPHGTSPDECDAAGYTSRPSGCPSIRSPHDIRRGSITTYLRDDVPVAAIRDRSNVSETVLDKHYDVRSESEKAEQRRKYFE